MIKKTYGKGRPFYKVHIYQPKPELRLLKMYKVRVYKNGKRVSCGKLQITLHMVDRKY